MQAFLFFFFGLISIAAAIGMLVTRNPVSSALWLVLNLFSIALLYLTLHASFIAVIQILVYAGAIMVLFLFVIMLLNLSALPRVQSLDWKRVVAFVLGMAVLAQLFYLVAMGLDALPGGVPAEEAARVGSAAEIGRALFTQHAFTIQVVGILLLAATIGAVLLAKRKFV
jgi:NADH-quinone oxidoreductase subunit J